MVAPHHVPTLRGLRAIREQLLRDHERFHDAPLHAVALFLEEDGEAGRAQFADTRPVASYLDPPASAVRLAELVPHQHGWTTPHDGPFFAYIPGRPDGGPAAVAALDRQLVAFGRHLDDLHRLTTGLTDRARRLLPPVPRNWWAILFHLAVHYPQSSLRVNRQRWVRVTSPVPGVIPPPTLPIVYPYRFRFDELRLQAGLVQVRCRDVVPGVVWGMLEGGVFAASAAAIDLLIETLETPPLPPHDLSAFRARVADLRERFVALAGGSGGRPTVRPADCRVLKVASSYRPPPASYWRAVSLDARSEAPLLARRHAEAEYLIHCLPQSALDLCAEAGAALPPLPDGPVLFPPPGNEPPPVLTSDPVARWMRFVFNTDGVADKRTFHTAGRPTEVYGYAALPDGLFAASVRAIEQAGLLPPPVVDFPPAVEPPEPQLTTPADDHADLDGPFELDGFRFAGVEVRFGQAVRQRALVLALWDTPSRLLLDARLVEDVLADVYGAENDTSDAAFRQLCSAVRRRFQVARLPLDIENRQGHARMVRLPV